jgi:signal transduction histidine kinase
MDSHPKPIGLNDHELEALQDFYENLLETLSPGAVLSKVVQEIPQMVGCQSAFIGEVDTSDSMTIRRGAGLNTKAIFDLEVQRGRGLGGMVMETLDPNWVNDYSHASGITHHYDTPVMIERLRAVAAVPIVGPDGLWGVLYGGSHDDLAFGDRSANLLAAAARRVSLALAVSANVRSTAEREAADERRRVALRLHDSVGAALFSVSAGLHRIGEQLAQDENLRDAIAGIEEQANIATQMLRESMRSLSELNDDAALPLEIKSLCESFVDRCGIPAEAIVLGQCPTLDEGRQRVVARCVAEALLNAEKHSRPTCVVCTIAPYASGTLTAVSNDGVPTHQAPTAAEESEQVRINAPTSLGLPRSEREVEAAGGWFEARATADNEFTVRIWMPSHGQ